MTSMSSHAAPAQLAEQYVALWNETDAGRRKALIGGMFSGAPVYVDPVAAASGRDELDTMIAAVQQQFAGLRFSVFGKQDGHHDVVRFSWALGPANAEPIVIGTDVAELDKDGRIARVTGFLDKVPQG